MFAIITTRRSIDDDNLVALDAICSARGSGNERRIIDKARDNREELTKEEIDTLQKLEIEFAAEIARLNRLAACS
jgi:hypothetical protein